MRTSVSVFLLCCVAGCLAAPDAIALARADPLSLPASISEGRPSPLAWPYPRSLPFGLPFPTGVDPAAAEAASGSGGFDMSNIFTTFMQLLDVFSPAWSALLNMFISLS